MPERINIDAAKQKVLVVYSGREGFYKVDSLLRDHVRSLSERLANKGVQPSANDLRQLNMLRTGLLEFSKEETTGETINPDPTGLLQLGLTQHPFFYTRDELTEIAQIDPESLQGLSFAPFLARLFLLDCFAQELRDGPPPERGPFYPNQFRRTNRNNRSSL